MQVQYSSYVRDAKNDAIETRIGTAPILELRSGPPAANCGAAPSGTLLAQFALPSDWMAASAAGVKIKAGAWSGAAVGTGLIAHFRIYESGSPSICHMQGDVGLAGSPDYAMTVDNPNVAPTQIVTVSSFQITSGNA